MRFRFSLYGFLKNQKYFEPIFYLILLNEKGLSFTMLGLLIGFGGICVNIMEIPSGAIADLYGRRKCMVLSFICYILSFIIYAFACQTAALFMAMFLFSIGEAFRTGTHKAMIFDWLRSRGRENERTRVYGFTRSWSKTGSALSAVIGIIFMLYWQTYVDDAKYSHIFLLCIVPYIAGLINFLGYPPELDNIRRDVSLASVFLHLRDTIRDAVKIPVLRKLFLESMSFEGMFKTLKDYVQPVAYQMVLGLSGFIIVYDKDKQTSLIVYSIYFILNIFAIFGSRFSYSLSNRLGSDEKGCRFILWISFILFVFLTIVLYYNLLIAGVIAFIILHVLHNLWRPMLISRFDSCSRPETGATILSIESQAKSLLTIAAAPLIGYAIDYINQGSPDKSFWPLGIFGIIFTLTAIIRGAKTCENKGL